MMTTTGLPSGGGVTSSKLELPVDKEVEEEASQTGSKRKMEDKLFVTDEEESRRDTMHSSLTSISSRDSGNGPIPTCGENERMGRDEEDDCPHHQVDLSDGAAVSCFNGVDKKSSARSTDEYIEELTNSFKKIDADEDVNPKGEADHLEGSTSLNTSFIVEEDEGVLSPLWKTHSKHVFILSEAGKPIYSRHGNEDKLATLFGVLQALVSFVQDSDDTIRCIRAGDVSIVFLLKAPLILVCVSRLGESISQIQTQLVYFYNQIVSILTAKQLIQIFEKRRNYDLRRLIAGSERLLHNLCGLVDRDPSFALGAVRCLPLANSVRDAISQTIAQTLSKLKQNVVFAILLANNQLVSLVRMKKCFMHPMDLHIIMNFIDASESFKTAETWSPICLPKFDSSGFVHAHVSYLSEECQACLILLTVDRESFFALSEAKKKIVERLQRRNCLEAINASMNNNWPTMSFVNVPEVRHFLYKSRAIAQFMSPAFEAPYINADSPAPPVSPGIHENLANVSVSSRDSATMHASLLAPTPSDELRRLYYKYYCMHSKLHSHCRPVKLIYWVDDTENWLGWLTSTFELYVTFEPLVKKSAAINAVNKLLKWIKKEEDRIFIVNSPTF